MIKAYDVTYKTKQGWSIHTSVLARNAGHAISSVTELVPEAHRIIQVLQVPEWT